MLDRCDIKDALPLLGITDIAIDPLAPATICVLSGDGEGGVAMHGPPSVVVLKSMDAGRTWNPTGLVWKINQSEYGHRLVWKQTSYLERALPPPTTVNFTGRTKGKFCNKICHERTHAGQQPSPIRSPRRRASASPRASARSPCWDCFESHHRGACAQARPRRHWLRGKDRAPRTRPLWVPQSQGRYRSSGSESLGPHRGSICIRDR